MKRYCFDTSGLSKPYQDMPEDIYGRLWEGMKQVITAGLIAVTKEIYDEMVCIEGSLGECIRANQAKLQLEIGQPDWNWEAYLAHMVRMQTQHHAYISEYTGGRKGTVGLKDLTIIGMAKTLGLPVVSMEVFITQSESKNRRIPNICHMEGVEHLDFNHFLRKQGLRL